MGGKIQELRELLMSKCLRSLESLKTCEMGKNDSPGTLYRRRNLVGVITLKVQEEISTVGSVPHRWMRETKRRLKQLMMYRKLRSVNNSYGECKTMLPHV